MKVKKFFLDHDKPMLLGIPQAVYGTQGSGVRLTEPASLNLRREVHAFIEANRGSLLSIKDSDLLLHKRGLEEHFRRVLEMQKRRR